MKKNQKDEVLKEAVSREEIPGGEETKAEIQEHSAKKLSDGKTEQEKMEQDIALFHELFPDVKAEDIPQEVWDQVEGGESLAAAYALYSIKMLRQEEKIRKVNEKNEKSAPPRIRHDGTEAEYFSPEAVKAMSRSEIKKHYDAILRSMEKWN